MLRRLALPVIALVLLLINAAPAHADHVIVFGDDDPVYGRYDQYNPVIQELRRTGITRWAYYEDPGSAHAFDDVQQALTEMTGEFEFSTAPINPDTCLSDRACLRIVSSAAGDFIYGNKIHGACGNWAIGCVTEFPSAPTVVLDTATMFSWANPRSRLEVILHELLHAIANLGEGYREGYVYGTTSCAPIDDGGVFPGIHRGLMNCGLFNAQQITDFERYAWGYSHGTGPAFTYGAGANAGGSYVYFCGTGPRVNAMALMAFRLNDGRYRWTGVTVPVRLDANGCMGYGAGAGEHRIADLLEAGELICLNLENRAAIRYGRNDTCIPFSGR